MGRQAGRISWRTGLDKKGTVTVNGHDGDTLSHGLVNAILKQAGLTKENLQ
jgi:hypothetical protein